MIVCIIGIRRWRDGFQWHIWGGAAVRLFVFSPFETASEGETRVVWATGPLGLWKYIYQEGASMDCCEGGRLIVLMRRPG